MGSHRVVQPIAVCFIVKDEEVLLLRRAPGKKVFPLKWDGIGGKIEPGETPRAACIREAKEEAGLEIRKPALRAVITFVDHKHNAEWIMFAFKVTQYSGTEPKENDEGLFQWFKFEEVLSVDLVPDLPYYIKPLLATKSETIFGCFEYDGSGNITKHHVDFD